MAARGVGAAAAMPVIGFLRSTHVRAVPEPFVAFRQGLKEAGFVEGRTLSSIIAGPIINIDRLPALVADLISPTGGGDRRRQRFRRSQPRPATTTVPIVFATGGDPVRNGIVASLSRPGANVTGISFFSGGLGAKRLELLRQLVPRRRDNCHAC